MSTQRSFTSTHHRSGFTLTELLVVIMIIGIVVAAVLSAFSGSDDVQTLRSASAKSSGLFSLARSTAITKKARTRVVVFANSAAGNEQKYLRYVTVLVEENRPLNGEGTWKMLTDGIFFPPGVFYHYSHSRPNAQPPNPTAMSFAINQDGVATVGSGDPYFVYEFSANGISQNSGARFLVTKAGVASAIRNDTPLLEGFMIFRGGRFRQIENVRVQLGL